MPQTLYENLKLDAGVILYHIYFVPMLIVFDFTNYL